MSEVGPPIRETALTAAKPAGYLRDPYPYFAEKRCTAGVSRGTVIDYSRTPESLRPADGYAAVSFEAVDRVFRDGRVFGSGLYDSTIGLFTGPTILAMDGRAHRAHRNLVSAAFTSTSLSQWEPAIVRPVVHRLIDEFADTGTADLVRAFTFEFPTRVIARMLGLPEEDLPMFRRRAEELISYTVDHRRAFDASAALETYFLEQIDLRRSHPTDDIIGDLATAEIDGEKLGDAAMVSFLRLLLPAGLETTYRASGNLLFLLLTHPEQLAAVRADHGLIPQAIEEALRYETPLTTVQRFTTVDTELDGVLIPKDTVVDACIGSANRDERRWDRAAEFDIFRDRRPHISFAAGAHTCLGLHLARMETRVALECLLDRVADIRLVSEGDPHIVGQPFRSPTAIPVTFEPVGS